MDKYHGQRRHSPAQAMLIQAKTKSETHESEEIDSTAQHGQDPPQTSSLNIPFWSSLCHTWHVLLLFSWSSNLPLASVSLPMEALSFARALMCSSSEPISKRFPLAVKVRRRAGRHQILKMLYRDGTAAAECHSDLLADLLFPKSHVAWETTGRWAVAFSMWQLACVLSLIQVCSIKVQGRCCFSFIWIVSCGVE